VAAVLAVCCMCCRPCRLLCWGGVPCGGWPLHGIAITILCMVYGMKRRIGGGAYIAQWLCKSIAIRKVLQVGGDKIRMINSHIQVLKRNNII